MEKQEKNVVWYNNASLVTWLIIGMITLIILSSQSFGAVGEVNALTMVQNILNHNISYMIMFVYFVFINTKAGKKYFDYFNIVILLFFTISFITSVLTLFQSFSLVSLLAVISNFLMLIYFFHVFLRGTRFWREFKLSSSPFNELGNDWYFNAILVVQITLYAVSLISMSTVDGTFLATYDCIYSILLARYIFLYGEYLNSIKKNCNNKGNFNEVREKIAEFGNDVVEKTSEVVNNVDLDQAVENAIGKVEGFVDNSRKKFDEINSNSNNAIKGHKEKKSDSKDEKKDKLIKAYDVGKSSNYDDRYEARKSDEKNSDIEKKTVSKTTVDEVRGAK